jgi:uncharacterized protein (DUF849 family)
VTVVAPLLQACLNGAREPGEHPDLPLDADALAMQSLLVWAAGAHAVHVHPRDAEGCESLHPGPCAEAVAAIRAAAPQLEVSVSTGAWIEPDPELRAATVEGWTIIPDVASVNFSEEGAERVCRALGHRGVRVEAGIATEEDAERFLGSACARWCERVLVEVADPEPEAAVAHAARIGEQLGGVLLPQLHHGEGRATWAVLVAAVRAGHAIRIGLEDTLELPDGRPVPGNEAMVRAASELQRRAAVG